MEILTEKKWEKARYFGDVYGISRTSLLRLWRKGTIRAKKTASSIQGAMFYNVADVDAYFNDITLATAPKPRKRRTLREEDVCNA